MSNTQQLGAIEYEAESSIANWGENVSTFATHRLPQLGAVDLAGLKQDKLPSGFLQQYMQGGNNDIPGIIGGSFKTRMHLTGHGGPTSGAMAVDALETFLSYVFGKITVGPAGSTFTGAGTAAAPTTVASSTFTAGALCRAGSLGDGLGNGQFVAINTHTATTLNLLTALGGVPANGHVLHSCTNLYLPEDASDAANSILGLRFRVLTANLRYEMHGCWPMSLTIGGVNTGETPFIEVEWGVSWWKPTAGGTFPSAVTSNQYVAAAVAAGSFFLNAVGTATRVVKAIRNFSVEISLGVQALMGPGGLGHPQQVYVGAKRIPSTIKVRWMQDADAAATATPEVEALHLAGTNQHVLYTLSTTAGSAVALYFRNLCITGARPVQVGDSEINRIAVEATAHTDATAASALRLAAMVLAYA